MTCAQVTGEKGGRGLIVVDTPPCALNGQKSNFFAGCLETFPPKSMHFPRGVGFHLPDVDRGKGASFFLGTGGGIPHMTEVCEVVPSVVFGYPPFSRNFERCGELKCASSSIF